MSTYAIGDVQGCFVELQSLLKKINFDPIQDTLWFTGDLVNRGPESLEVLRFIKGLGNRVVTVLGNHDLHLLAVAHGVDPLKKKDTFDEILAAPDKDSLLTWLRMQPLLHYDASFNYALVHAGFAPQWDLETARACAKEVEMALQHVDYIQYFKHMYSNEPTLWSPDLQGFKRLCYITNALTRMRFCTPVGELDFTYKQKHDAAPHGYVPWFECLHRKNKDVRIIFGHWAAIDGETGQAQTIALDTGCIWGRALTAFRLEDGKRFCVNCERFAAQG